ncbi:MAG: hypothetical protein ACTSPB_15325 [Candidatus Thorarchaeota archaeon]
MTDASIIAQADSIHELVKNGDLEFKEIAELEDYGIPWDAILMYFEKYKGTIPEKDLATFKMTSALR